MPGCYYCKDYDVEENRCLLFNKESELPDDCDYFEFDTGIDGDEEDDPE